MVFSDDKIITWYDCVFSGSLIDPHLLGCFNPLISHVARYAPSLCIQDISKI